MILIPAYNEEDNISRVIDSIPKNISGVEKVEIVVIDDGSGDKTSELAKVSGAKVLRHNTNQGVGAALASGIDYARQQKFDLMVNIDADGQFDSNQIFDLIKPIQRGQADFVSGSRFFGKKPEKMSLSKYWGNKLMSKFVSALTGEKFRDVSCGFRAYSRETLLRLNLFGRFTYTQEMFLDIKFKNLKIKEVPIEVKYFLDRKSRVANNLFKYAWKTLVIIVRSMVYYKPLRFFALPGIFLLIFGFGFICFLLWHKIFIGSYSPFKAFGFIGGGLALFGLLMILIGLISDVIDRVRQIQEKILYNIMKKQ